MSRSRLLLTAYLDRSANQKMTVRISILPRLRYSDFVHLGPLLRQSTSRWVDCRLDTNSLPCLRILDIKGCDLYEDVGITILSMLESRCPLPGKETNSRSGLTPLFLSRSIARKIGECMMLCFDDGIRGIRERWDDLFT
ncbi:hypothetical protein BDZ89DRAFT_227668 [Hymenopellis radicata]|nr:hypothetical protein BDZ89DRAFT_227668 [Hymenopellis radicata]